MRVVTILGLLLVPQISLASASGGAAENLGLTGSFLGILALMIFVFAYSLVMAEEFIHLRKSKPVIFAAGMIWVIVAYLIGQSDLDPHTLEINIQHNLIEYASLFLFLLVAMTYINAMTERNVFEALRSWLVNRKFGNRALFWITGFIAFFLSPIADNLTTALLMGAVVLSVGAGNPSFIAVSCINIGTASASPAWLCLECRIRKPRPHGFFSGYAGAGDFRCRLFVGDGRRVHPSQEIEACHSCRRNDLGHRCLLDRSIRPRPAHT